MLLPLGNSGECATGSERELIPGDRRLDQRYSAELDLHFTVMRKGRTEAVGWGRTVNIGRGGLCFKAPHLFEPGSQVEVSIDWPFLLQNRCPLQLVVKGRIAWHDENGTGLKMVKYEFRTCGPRSFESGSDPAGTRRNFLG